MFKSTSLLLSIPFLLQFTISFPVYAGEIFDSVRERGEVRCGIHAERPGLAVRNGDGERVGFEIDLCRSWSAAVFGTGDQVSFVEITDETGLPALVEKRIDVLALHEDALFGRREVSFAGNAFVDSLALMVRRGDAVSNTLELDGKRVCISSAEEEKGRLEAFASENRITFQTTETTSLNEAMEALEEGSCDALLSGRLALASLRSALARGTETFEILPELFSKRLLGPVTLSDDRAWLNVVRWGVFAMVVAEEKQVSSENLSSQASSTKDPSVKRLLGFEGNFGDQLGLDPLWAYRIVETVGNFGEVYERHFGPSQPTALERGPNALWLDGGLMRAPPFQ